MSNKEIISEALNLPLLETVSYKEFFGEDGLTGSYVREEAGSGSSIIPGILCRII